MRLDIISIKGKVLEAEVRSVNLKTKTGEITILNNHRPLVTLLEKCEVKIKSADGKDESVNINSGFLEMSPGNILTLLVD